MNVAVLASEGTRLLTALANRRPGGAVPVLVVADDPDAPAVDAAEELGVATAVVGRQDDAALSDLVADHDVDLVVADDVDPGAAGEGALPPTLVGDPTLDPEPGTGDPVASALEDGRRITGSTVRLRSSDGDGIVTQEPVGVYGDDDRATLADRVQREGTVPAATRAVRLFAEGAVSVDGDGVTVEGDDGGEFPARRITTGDRTSDLRYGENPHQDAALYGRSTAEASVVGAPQHNEGAKDLSYNNYNDADAALDLVKEFDRPAAAVIKHTNPAGCATADDLRTAYDRALSTDAMSAYGGVVALNRECDRRTAAAITDSYKEIVVAPSYTDDALETLCETESLRVLPVGDPDVTRGRERFTETSLVGGRLVQERDDQRPTPADLEVVTEREPTEAQLESMLFAWQTIKHVKSNAILYAKGTETVGIGAGQVSRVDAVEIASRKARDHAEGKSADGAVMASDAFFPFPDGVERAAEAGIEAVIQPGGSVNDDDVIEAADDLGLAMAFTGTRCFRHD